MGFFDFLGKAASGLTGGVQKGVRGLGRLARGNFGEALSDFGSVAQSASVPLTFFNPGAATALAALGGLAQGQGGGGGFLPDNVVNVPQVTGSTLPGGGDMGFLGKMGGWLGGDGSNRDAILRLGSLLAGVGGAVDKRSQRRSHEQFAQQRLNTLMAALGRGEERMDAKQPLRDSALASLQAMIQQPGFLQQQLR